MGIKESERKELRKREREKKREREIEIAVEMLRIKACNRCRYIDEECQCFVTKIQIGRDNK